MDNAAEIVKTLDNLSGTIDRSGDVSIILAAGHGKRIKSEKSKMLHEIWGKPSVCRVCDAAARGLDSDNQIVVVGKKALDVAEKLGRKKGRVFVYQEEQRGTGHAVRIALAHAQLRGYSGSVFIFPGDMGLLEETTVRKMKERFYGSDCDMLALTGTFEGAVEDNYYGRILTSTRYPDRIIEIKEHRDILAMEESHHVQQRLGPGRQLVGIIGRCQGRALHEVPGVERPWLVTGELGVAQHAEVAHRGHVGMSEPGQDLELASQASQLVFCGALVGQLKRADRVAVQGVHHPVHH